jgi:hypothetical protein
VAKLASGYYSDGVATCEVEVSSCVLGRIIVAEAL